MTSSNANSIWRTNMNLKPWILSKNTTEIVNKCIQKIYKQTPNNFMNELQQVKTLKAKPENRGPIRSFRSQERVRVPVSVTTRPKNLVSNLNPQQLLNAIMMKNKRAGAVASLVGNKKLLKSPNYKIYGSRRFGSSTSSLNGSICRRLDDRRRNLINHQTSQLNLLLRSLGTKGTPKTLGVSSAAPRYLAPARNQHMESRVSATTNPLLVSSAIQGDLMQINETLKSRISLGRNRTQPQPSNGFNCADPMDGWHHPPPLFLARVNERFAASAELHKQQHHIRLANKLKSELHLRQEAKLTLTSTPLPGSQKLSRQRISDAYNRNAKERLIRMQQHVFDENRCSRFGSRRSLTMSGGECTSDEVGVATLQQEELLELTTTSPDCAELVISSPASTSTPAMTSHQTLAENGETPLLLKASTKPVIKITKTKATPKVSAIPRLTAERKVKASDVSAARATTATATSIVAANALTLGSHGQGRYNRSSYHSKNKQKLWKKY